MLAIGDDLYLATNNGAFFAINLTSHEIEWALQHDTKPLDPNDGRMWWGYMQQAKAESADAIMSDNGVFYLKDGSASTLYALDLSAPAVKWKRLISSDDSLAAIDGQTAYLVGHELSALDLASRKLRWSTKIPNDNGAVRLLICPKHVFVPTDRGIFDIDPANGDVRRVFRGADRASSIGELLLAGNKCIAVSSSAITAYPIQPTDSPKIGLRTTK